MSWKRGSGSRTSILESWEWPLPEAHLRVCEDQDLTWQRAPSVMSDPVTFMGFRRRKWRFIHNGLQGKRVSDRRELNSAAGMEGGRDERRGGIEHLSGLGHIWLKYMTPVWRVIFIRQPDKPEPLGQRYSLLLRRTWSQADAVHCCHNLCWLMQE